MKLEDILTIVIPLKGRPEYTKRILEYASWAGCPFKILLGDGGDDDLVLNQKDFDVDFEYIRYPYDKDIPTYCAKLSNMLFRVTTPLTMMIDNDNFFCLDGVYRVIKFLHDNKDFYGGRGCLTRCQVQGNELGPERRKMHYFPSIVGETASERVVNNINMFHTHLHDVARTNVLQTTHEILRLVASNDLKVAVRLNALCAIAHGNNYRDDSFTYFFHEDGTPRIYGLSLPLDRLWVLQPYWNDTCARLASAVGAGISHVDGIELRDAKRIFIENFISHMFANEDDNHRVTDIGVKERLLGSIEDVLDLSEELGFDEKIINCINEKETDMDFILEKDFNIKEVDDDEFRVTLNKYLKVRRYCR